MIALCFRLLVPFLKKFTWIDQDRLKQKHQCFAPTSSLKLLMVQKSQGQVPGMYPKPCKWWGELPTSSGKRRNSAINRRNPFRMTDQPSCQFAISLSSHLPFQVLNNWWMPVTGVENGTGDGYWIHVHNNLLSVIQLYSCVIGFKCKHGRSHSSSLKFWRGSSHISSYLDAQNGGISHSWQGQMTPVPSKIKMLIFHILGCPFFLPMASPVKLFSSYFFNKPYDLLGGTMGGIKWSEVMGWCSKSGASEKSVLPHIFASFSFQTYHDQPWDVILVHVPSNCFV